MGMRKPPLIQVDSATRTAPRSARSRRFFAAIASVIGVAVFGAYSAFSQTRRGQLQTTMVGLAGSSTPAADVDANVPEGDDLAAQVSKVAGDVMFALLPGQPVTAPAADAPALRGLDVANTEAPLASSNAPPTTAPAPFPGPTDAPAATTGDWRTWALRSAPAEPTPFPDNHVSRLVQAARQEGVRVPDILRRGRSLAAGGGDQFGGCPPYHGVVPSLEVRRLMGGEVESALHACSGASGGAGRPRAGHSSRLCVRTSSRTRCSRRWGGTASRS